MAESRKTVCGKCHKNINLTNKKCILCDGNCKMSFHLSCSKISTKEFKEYSENNDKLWFCQICKTKRDRRKSSILSQIISSESESEDNDQVNQVNESEDNNIIEKNVNSQKNNENINLKDIYDIVKQLLTDFNDLKLSFESLKSRIKEVNADNIELLRENIDLKDRINIIECNMHKQKQYSLRNNFEISGVPVKENENLKQIVNQIINIDNDNIIMSDSNIEIIYRKHENENQNKNGFPPIICVKVNNYNVKKSIFQNKKKIIDNLKNKSNKNDLPIYINESLTKHFSYLHKKARDLKRKKKLKYVWVKNGNLFIRETDDKPSVKVLSIEHLIEYEKE